MKLTLFLFLSIILTSFDAYSIQGKPVHKRYLDSTETYLDRDIALSRIYFDSILNPSENNLKENIAQYYYLKASLDYEAYGLSASLQNYVKSLSYAEKYKQFKVAGMSSGELASKFYLAKKDSLADIYYHKAIAFYTKINDENGLLDLMQFPAYAKYANGELQESIDLVLKDLDTYKAVKGDQMYYSFAIFLLTSNYVDLKNLEEGHRYYSIYKSLKGNEFIDPYFYLRYENAIKICFAEYYFQNKNLDSIKHYLDGIQLKEGASDLNVRLDRYNIYIEYYKLNSEPLKAQAYMDSLNLFNNEIMENTIDTSIEFTEDLSKTKLELAQEVSAKKKSNTYIYLLILAITTLIILLFVFLKKKRKRDFAFSELKNNFSTLKVKQEKLSVVNLEFEEYLTSLKKEVKRIAQTSSITEQKESILKLNREIYLNQRFFVNSEDHYKLLNTLNEPFFVSIENKHPQLDPLEVQICYYLFTGFKNKEIATFTDRSLRAVEGKRYRIAKKLDFDTEEENLKDFLKRTFENENPKNLAY